MRFEYSSTVENIIWAYDFESIVFLLGTSLFNACSWLIHKKKKNNKNFHRKL